MLTPAGQGLLWRQWDVHHIVYQPSSTETHVFNETTARVMRCLERGPATVGEVAAWTVDSLGIEKDELAARDLEFAMGRLEELGIIELSDEAAAAP